MNNYQIFSAGYISAFCVPTSSSAARNRAIKSSLMGPPPFIGEGPPSPLGDGLDRHKSFRMHDFLSRPFCLREHELWGTQKINGVLTLCIASPTMLGLRVQETINLIPLFSLMFVLDVGDNAVIVNYGLYVPHYAKA
jgi:hypothetical protein